MSRSGFFARRVWFRNPFSTPRCWRTIHIARDAGIGDVIMCTAALRALKEANPRGRICFYTNFGELVSGLPYIDEVRPYAERPSGTIFIEYTDVMPSPAHIIKLMGDRIDIAVTDTRPDCIVDPDRIAFYRQEWACLPRPHVVVLRRASRFTPNKDWPEENWSGLVAQLCATGAVIELGSSDTEISPPPATNYLDLRDRTNTRDLAAAIAAADIYVGPVSGPMHIAAALGTPSVVVIGGYEHPDNAHYDGNIAFYTALPCSPCWLREPCPFDLKCLTAISSQAVKQAVDLIWQKLQTAEGTRAEGSPFDGSGDLAAELSTQPSQLG